MKKIFYMIAGILIVFSIVMVVENKLKSPPNINNEKISQEIQEKEKIINQQNKEISNIKNQHESNNNKIEKIKEEKEDLKNNSDKQVNNKNVIENMQETLLNIAKIITPLMMLFGVISLLIRSK